MVDAQPINHKWTMLDPIGSLHLDQTVVIYDSQYTPTAEPLKEFSFNFTGELLPDTNQPYFEYCLSVKLSLQGDNSIRSFGFKQGDVTWASVDIDSVVNLQQGTQTEFEFKFILRVLKATKNISSGMTVMYLKSDPALDSADLEVQVSVELCDLANANISYANLASYAAIGLEFPSASHLRTLNRITANVTGDTQVLSNGVKVRLSATKLLPDIKVIYLPIICSLGLMILIKRVKILATGATSQSLTLNSKRSLTMGLRVDMMSIANESN